MAHCMTAGPPEVERWIFMLKKVISFCVITVLLASLTSFAQDKNQSKKKVPDEKGGLLDANSAVRGAGFRITVVHPMRGDFAEYDKLEIVDTTSDIGSRIPAEEMEKYTARLFLSFDKSGVFRQVRRVGQLDFTAGRSIAAGNTGAQPQENGGGYAAPAGEPKRTMVLVNRVIYFKQGDRTLRAIGLGWGYHRMVVRFQLVDKERGVELAMGNISGEVTAGFFSVPLIAGNADARNSIAGALINRVEVRRGLADH